MRIKDRMQYIKRAFTFKKRNIIVSIKDWAKNFFTNKQTPVREVIFQTIAREFAKIDLFAYEEKEIEKEGKREYTYNDLKQDSLNAILQLRVNGLLGVYEWKYIVAYQMKKYGNSLTEIVWKNKETYEIDSFLPLDMERYSFGDGYQLQNGKIILKLRDNRTGELCLLNYEDFIHIRLHPNDVFGGDKSTCIDGLDSLVKLFDTNLNTTLNELINSGEIRGILKLGNAASELLDNALLGEDEKTQKQEEIKERIVAAKGGVLVLDSGEDFKELDSPFNTMSEKQMNEWMKYIYAFSGINEAVINGTATEEQMEVFFNKSIVTIIEPFIEEMNYKCLSKNIRTRGRKIDYRRNPFEYISITKAMDAVYKGLSITKQNEMRKMVFKLPPVEGGDVLLNNLNFIKENSTEKGGTNGEKNT